MSPAKASSSLGAMFILVLLALPVSASALPPLPGGESNGQGAERFAAARSGGKTATARKCVAPEPWAQFLKSAVPRLDELAGRIRAPLEAYERLAGEARQDLPAFKKATAACSRIPDLHKHMDEIVLEAPGNVREMTNALDAARGMLTGKGSFAFGVYSSRLNEINDILVPLIWILDGVRRSKVMSLREQLRLCAGFSSSAVFGDAVRFGEKMESVERAIRDAHERVVKLRNENSEFLELWIDYHTACIEYAQCKRISAAVCERLPQD